MTVLKIDMTALKKIVGLYSVGIYSIPPIDALEIQHIEPNMVTSSNSTDAQYNTNNPSIQHQNIDASIHAHMTKMEPFMTKAYINAITLKG